MCLHEGHHALKRDMPDYLLTWGNIQNPCALSGPIVSGFFGLYVKIIGFKDILV